MSLSLAEKWLKLLALLHIIGGLLLPLLVLTSFSEGYFEGLKASFPDSSPDSMRFLVGIFGPTVASWGLLFYFSVGKAFASKSRKDWLTLLLALLIWSLLDSLYSLYFGIFSHLLINGITLFLFITPLLIVRTHFQK